MHPLLKMSALLLLAGMVVRADKPSSDVKEAVLQAEQSWRTAVLKADRNRLAELMTEDLSYTHSSALTQTKEQFITAATDGSTVYRAIDFEATTLRQYGDTVVVTHPTVITTVQTGTLRLYLTEVWVRKNGRWQMASRQATKMP